MGYPVNLWNDLIPDFQYLSGDYLMMNRGLDIFRYPIYSSERLTVGTIEETSMA